ncbi:MAG: hypothetical protein CMH98_06810 [Oceanospirillaceae bacterium]|nr:hypothetical protein [Oceanospirillaceae bacterium]
MSLSFKEKRAHQKTVRSALAALKREGIKFAEKRSLQKQLKGAMSALGMLTKAPIETLLQRLLNGDFDGATPQSYLEKMQEAYSQDSGKSAIDDLKAAAFAYIKKHKTSLTTEATEGRILESAQERFLLQDRYQFQKLPISIETKAGQSRSGTDPDDHDWSIAMQYDYGYIRGTKGADGEEIDVYIGPNRSAENVYIVKQHAIEKVKAWPSDHCPKCQKKPAECACPEFYDEDKVFLGFDSEPDARAAYITHYDDPRFLGPIETMPIDEYRATIQLSAKEAA